MAIYDGTPQADNIGLGTGATTGADSIRGLAGDDTIDGSGGFYRNQVDPDCRSRMNVPFTLANPELDHPLMNTPLGKLPPPQPPWPRTAAPH